MTEPKLLFCTMRDRLDDDGSPVIDLECRFDDGQKFATIEVDGEFENLATSIHDHLNRQGLIRRMRSALKRLSNDDYVSHKELVELIDERDVE